MRLAQLLLPLATFLLLFLLVGVDFSSASSLLRNIASGYERLQHLKRAIKEKIHQVGHDPNSTILYAFDPSAAALLSAKALKLEQCYHASVQGTVMSIFEQKLKVVVLHFLTSYNYTHYDGQQSSHHWLERILHIVGNLLHHIHAIAGHIIDCVRRSAEDKSGSAFLPTKVGLNRFSAMSVDEFAQRHANPLPKALGPMGKVGGSNPYSSGGGVGGYNAYSHVRPGQSHYQHYGKQHQQQYNNRYYPSGGGGGGYYHSGGMPRLPNKGNRPAHRPQKPSGGGGGGTGGSLKNSAATSCTEEYSQFDVEDVKDGDLPATLDYRTEGVVSRVKDQGTAQTCFLFAAVDAIESSYMLAKKRRGITFSAKELYNCLPAAGVPNPDKGGNVETVLTLGSSRGVVDEKAGDRYPEGNQPGIKVMPEPAKCRSSFGSSVLARVKGFAKISDLNDVKTLKKILYKYGPVSTVFRSPAKNTQAHTAFSALHGKFNMPCVEAGATPEAPSHAMLLVGWENNYFILKNSYGNYPNDRWGIEGYMYLLMRNAANCAVLGSDSSIVFPSVM